MTRTDVHAPTNLKPEDYEFVACGNYPTAEVDGFSPIATTHKYLIDEGWRFDGVSGGNCDHCGAFIIYYAILKHLPSHTLIKVGETCLDNRFSLANAEFQKLRKAAKLNRERKRLSDKREAWLNCHPCDAGSNRRAYEWAKTQPEFDRDGFNESFEAKFVRYIDRYGEASVKFVAAILRSRDRQTEWETKKAKEAKTAQPMVEGKGLITGEIVSLKWKDTEWGGALKMLVKDERGFKVYGNAPKALVEQLDERLAALYTEAGNNDDPYGQPGASTFHYKDLLPLKASFSATVKASPDDSTFGFFSRPNSANILD